MIAFPSLRPSDLDWTLPSYPVLHNVWRDNISEEPQLLGNLSVDSRLSLRYRNITNAEALEFLDAWSAAGGSHRPLDPLPASFDQMFSSVGLADLVLRPAGLVWAFEREPRLRSVKAGRSNVDIDLIAEFRT